MKKIFAAILAAILLVSCPLALAAQKSDGLPFELVPPQNVYATWLEGNDSPTTVALSYSLDNGITSFFSELEKAIGEERYEEFAAEHGFGEIFITSQIDWALDDVNDPVSGWHCNEYWNADYGFGYDSDYRFRVGAWDCVDAWPDNASETVQNVWVLRGFNEDGYYGDPENGIPGLKDQLRADQYTYDADESVLTIDFTKHTAYLRVRLVVTVRDNEDNETYRYSEWSEVCSVGKDAEAYAPITKSDLPAPEITGLHMTDKEFNDNPVVAFTLSVPDTIARTAAKAASSGGSVWIETQARVKGDAEWTNMANTDSSVKTGEMECALLHLVNAERPTIPADTEIELRCRYGCSQRGADEDVYSDWSKIIGFGSDDIQYGGSEGGDSQGDGAGSSANAKCPICHFCPQPLGLCIFIWLAIIIAIVVIVIIIVSRNKKNKK